MDAAAVSTTVTPDSATRTVESDVVVVGAGPGGATLAYLLARSGVDVALVERAGDLKREFRGYLFQPLVCRVFEECGLLGDVLALDHDAVETLSIEVYGREYALADFSSDGPERSALLMEQAPLLRLLIESADAYPGFTYHDETTVEGLRRDDAGRLAGVVARDRRANETVAFSASLVVGADGRYSTVRDAAGIDPGRDDSDLELVWFKLPRDAVPGAAQFTLGPGGFVLYFGLGREEGQAGAIVREGTYASLRAEGIESFRERLAAADPRLRGVLESALSDFSDCSLLDVAPGFAERWTGDGLLLLGDAAHIASPVGGQGNSLAVQDAVLAHPAITEAVDGDATPTPVPRATLRAWEEVRREDVREVLDFQRTAARVIGAYTRARGRAPRQIEAVVLRAAFGLLARVGLPERIRGTLAMGPRGGEYLHVATEYFE